MYLLIWLLCPQKFTQKTKIPWLMSRYLGLFLPAYCPPWKSVTPHGPKCKGRQASLCLRSNVPILPWGTALYSSPPASHLPSPQGGSSWASPWAEVGWDWERRYWGPPGGSWICPFPEVTTRQRVGLSSRILPGLWKAEVRNLEIGGHFWGKPIYHHREKDWRISPECWFSLST